MLQCVGVSDAERKVLRVPEFGAVIIAANSGGMS